MDFDSATCQEAAGQRSFLIGCFSVWKDAAVTAAAVSAGPCLTQVDQEENTDCVSAQPESTAEWHPAWDCNTEWQTVGAERSPKASKVNHFSISPVHLLRRHFAKQALREIDHGVGVCGHCTSVLKTGYIQNTESTILSDSLLHLNPFVC